MKWNKNKEVKQFLQSSEKHEYSYCWINFTLYWKNKNWITACLRGHELLVCVASELSPLVVHFLLGHHAKCVFLVSTTWHKPFIQSCFHSRCKQECSWHKCHSRCFSTLLFVDKWSDPVASRATTFFVVVVIVLPLVSVCLRPTEEVDYYHFLSLFFYVTLQSLSDLQKVPKIKTSVAFWSLNTVNVLNLQKKRNIVTTRSGRGRNILHKCL